MPLLLTKLPRKAKTILSWFSIRYLLVELVIVFVGVYGAILLGNYNEERQRKEERQKVYTALRKEIAGHAQNFRDIIGFQVKFNQEVKGKLDNGEAPVELKRLRYIAPQYSLEVMENALQRNTFELMDLPMHIQLSRFHSFIQMLIHAEQKITEASEHYVNLHHAPPDMVREQYRWSFTYLKDREEILKTLIAESEKLLKELDQRIVPE